MDEEQDILCRLEKLREEQYKALKELKKVKKAKKRQRQFPSPASHVIKRNFNPNKTDKTPKANNLKTPVTHSQTSHCAPSNSLDRSDVVITKTELVPNSTKCLSEEVKTCEQYSSVEVTCLSSTTKADQNFENKSFVLQEFSNIDIDERWRQDALALTLEECSNHTNTTTSIVSKKTDKKNNIEKCDLSIKYPKKMCCLLEVSSYLTKEGETGTSMDLVQPVESNGRKIMNNLNTPVTIGDKGNDKLNIVDNQRKEVVGNEMMDSNDEEKQNVFYAVDNAGKKTIREPVLADEKTNDFTTFHKEKQEKQMENLNDFNDTNDVSLNSLLIDRKEIKDDADVIDSGNDSNVEEHVSTSSRKRHEVHDHDQNCESTGMSHVVSHENIDETKDSDNRCRQDTKDHHVVHSMRSSHTCVIAGSDINELAKIRKESEKLNSGSPPHDCEVGNENSLVVMTAQTTGYGEDYKSYQFVDGRQKIKQTVAMDAVSTSGNNERKYSVEGNMGESDDVDETNELSGDLLKESSHISAKELRVANLKDGCGDKNRGESVNFVKEEQVQSVVTRKNETTNLKKEISEEIYNGSRVVLEVCLQHSFSESGHCSKVQHIRFLTHKEGDNKVDLIAVSFSRLLVMWMAEDSGSSWIVLHKWLLDKDEAIIDFEVASVGSYIPLVTGGNYCKALGRVYSLQSTDVSKKFHILEDFTFSDVGEANYSFEKICVLPSDESNRSTTNIMVILASSHKGKIFLTKWTIDLTCLFLKDCKDFVDVNGNEISSLLVVEKGNSLLLGCVDAVFYLWNYESCEMLRKMDLQRHFLCKPVCVSAETVMGIIFLSLVYEEESKEGKVKLYALNPENKLFVCLKSLELVEQSRNERSFYCCKIAEYVLCSFQNGAIVFLNIVTDDRTRIQPEHGEVSCVSFHLKDSILAYGTYSGCVYLNFVTVL